MSSFLPPGWESAKSNPSGTLRSTGFSNPDLWLESSLMAFGLDVLLLGVYACLVFFILYCYYTIPNSRISRSSRILTRLIVLMFVIRLVHIGGLWYEIWFGFVDQGNSRDSTFNAMNGPQIVYVLGDATSVLSTAIADSIMVWRCWVICNFPVGRKLTVILLVLNIIGIAFGIAYFALALPINISGYFNLEPQYVLMSIINMSFSVATTILSTLLITARILMAANAGKTGTQQPYSKSMEVIIESSALYTISFLVYIPFFSLSLTSDWVATMLPYVESIAQSMTGIAPTLIMLRVLMGRARTDNNRFPSHSKITTIQFKDNVGSPGSQMSEFEDDKAQGVDIWETYRGPGQNAMA